MLRLLALERDIFILDLRSVGGLLLLTVALVEAAAGC